MLKAIFVLVFVAFLRLGEILIRSKAHSEKVLQVADVAINYEKGTPANLNITLRLSKNIKTSQPALFPITANEKNHNLCPVQAIHEYIQLFKPIQGPLFQFLGNSPVTHSFMSSKLHMLLQFISLDPKCYKGHSFRIDAATNAVNMGFSEQYIRKLGRWNSNAIQKYIRISSFNL